MGHFLQWFHFKWGLFRLVLNTTDNIYRGNSNNSADWLQPCKGLTPPRDRRRCLLNCNGSLEALWCCWWATDHKMWCLCSELLTYAWIYCKHLKGGKSGTNPINVFENKRCDLIHTLEHKLQCPCTNLISDVISFSWLWVGPESRNGKSENEVSFLGTQN